MQFVEIHPSCLKAGEGVIAEFLPQLVLVSDLSSEKCRKGNKFCTSTRRQQVSAHVKLEVPNAEGGGELDRSTIRGAPSWFLLSPSLRCVPLLMDAPLPFSTVVVFETRHQHPRSSEHACHDVPSLFVRTCAALGGPTCRTQLRPYQRAERSWRLRSFKS